MTLLNLNVDVVGKCSGLPFLFYLGCLGKVSKWFFFLLFLLLAINLPIMLFPTANDFETLSFILKVSQSISLNRKNYNTNYSHAKCQHIAQLLELPIFILFLLIYFTLSLI